MKIERTLASVLLASVAAAGLAALPAGCGKSDDHDHSHAEGDHDHDHAHGEGDHGGAAASGAMDDGHGGAVIEMGETSVGGYQVRASRDGDVVAGKDAPIDVWVTGGKPIAAVRFWIGVEDGTGSVKAKAELEKDNWHTHADAPNPMPEGSKLWVEIESDDGSKTVCSFDLKL
jgi:hypothetical protein